jgi:hypothetical protein
VHSPGSNEGGGALSTKSLSLVCGKRCRLRRKLVLIFFLLRSVCLCALYGSFLTYREELWCCFFAPPCAVWLWCRFLSWCCFFFLSQALCAFPGRLRSAKETRLKASWTRCGTVEMRQPFLRMTSEHMKQTAQHTYMPPVLYFSIATIILAESNSAWDCGTSQAA